MAIYEISVDAAFAARHSVPRADGTWEDTHEHAWQVTAVFRGPAIEAATGFLLDFLQVQAALAEATGELDGADLNSLPAFAEIPPSAERVAERLAGRLIDILGPGAPLACVRVTEAPGCRAAYFPEAAEPE